MRFTEEERIQKFEAAAKQAFGPRWKARVSSLMGPGSGPRGGGYSTRAMHRYERRERPLPALALKDLRSAIRAEAKRLTEVARDM